MMSAKPMGSNFTLKFIGRAVDGWPSAAKQNKSAQARQRLGRFPGGDQRPIRIPGGYIPLESPYVRDLANLLRIAFQDITGQRITKVVRSLQSMEDKLGSLIAAFGPLEGAMAAAAPQGDAALLNGPQLGRNSSSQTDIDALFEGLG